MSDLFNTFMNTVNNLNERLKDIEDEHKEIEGFIVDNDDKAEYILRKISEEKIESYRLTKISENMIQIYKDKIQKENERLRYKLLFLEGKLRNYFESVEHKKTKTQETYRLPTGVLKLKYKSTIEKDDIKLKEYLEKNNKDYIEIETIEKVKWGEFKKNINFVEGKAVTLEGEILDFITETIEGNFSIEEI